LLNNVIVERLVIFHSESARSQECLVTYRSYKLYV